MRPLRKAESGSSWTYNPALGDGGEEVDIITEVLRRASADVAHYLQNKTKHARTRVKVKRVLPCAWSRSRVSWSKKRADGKKCKLSKRDQPDYPCTSGSTGVNTTQTFVYPTGVELAWDMSYAPPRGGSTIAEKQHTVQAYEEIHLESVMHAA